MMNINDVINYTKREIDYDKEQIEQRNMYYNEFIVFIRLKDVPITEKYREYLVLTKIYDIRKDNISEKEFNKWYSQYDKKLEEKIKGFSARWGYSKDYILNKLKESDDFILQFSIDPGKTTYHQHFAANWLKENVPFISNFNEPVNGGDNSLICEGGKVLKSKDYKKEHSSKTIDFAFEYEFNNKKLYFYATHKYTKEKGGAQDNQFNDVKLFLKQAMLNTNPDIVLLSITDGEYYQSSKIEGDKKYDKAIDIYKENFNSEYCISTTCNTIIYDLVPIIIRWLRDNFSIVEIEDEVYLLQELTKK